jgi:hypothetical protein
MRKLLVAVIVALLPACGDDGGGGGGNDPTPVTQPPAPPATTQPPAPPPTIPNVAGFWDSEARRWHFELRQTGATINGTVLGFRDTYYGNTDHPDLQIRGTVSTSGAVTFNANAFSISFDGRRESSTRMTGTIYDCGSGNCRSFGEVLVRVGN